MSSEGIQITIPTLDDDDSDLRSTPVPFGRSHNFGAFGQGRNSPTLTPLALPERADRPFFHSREDSGQSFESDKSFKYAALTNGKVFASAHSSQSSLVSAGLTKKSSFASLKNAFKSSTKSDKADNYVPPVPPLDTHALPGLSNPFSRSQTNLTYQVPAPNRRRPSVNASPPLSTPIRTLNRGNHSFSGGSIFHNSHNSDGDSAFGSPHLESPPPVPKMPFGRPRAQTTANEPVENIPSEPKTPAEYALHAIFTRFVTSAEAKIEAFLKQSKEREPSLQEVLGPGIDRNFDELLESFSKIAQKHAQALITSILRWRKSVGANAIKQQFIYEAPTHNRSLSRTPDVPAIERERRSMAAIYVMCRALIVILRCVPKDALGQAMGNILEETTFEPFRRPNPKLLSSSPNHRANVELFGTLLGHLANIRFETVSDRFIAELRPIMEGSVSKDIDLRFEVLVRAAKHLELKVWPPESFEEGADFMERFARCFENAHGQRLKIAFAETLVQLLHPIGKTAQAEVNHPIWAKAIDVIHSKAKEMAAKPRYWLVAYPLVVSSLCVAPQEFFLKQWNLCLDSGFTRLKDKSHRTCLLNGAVRLVWSYLFRCREPATTLSMKLEPLMKNLFPANRGTILPAEESTSPLILLVHFAFIRQFEFGVELITFLIQEKALMDITVHKQVNPDAFYPDRMVIAIKAIVLSLTAMEKDQRVPAWPSSFTYSVYDVLEPDYPSSGETLPESFYASKPALLDFYNRFAKWIYWITRLAGQAVGSVSVVDERWTQTGLVDGQDEPAMLIVHRLKEGTFAYPRHLLPWVELLQVCYESWPRCLDTSMPINDCVDMMIRGVIHVEPGVSDAATAALMRYSKDLSSTRASVARLTHFLFSPRSIAREGTGSRLAFECAKILNLWGSLCERLAELYASESAAEQSNTFGSDDSALLDEVQAAGLFLLSMRTSPARAIGFKVLNSVERVALSVEQGITGVTEGTLSTFLAMPRNWSDHTSRYTAGLDPVVTERLKTRLSNTNAQDLLCGVESEGEDSMWPIIRPALFRAAMDLFPRIAVLCRDCVQATVLRYHNSMSVVAEMSGKGPLGLPIRSNSQAREIRDPTEHRAQILQWTIWIQILCITALPSEIKPNPAKGHSRIPSDLSSIKDRIASPRGLFRHLIPFLSSDHLVFREAVVTALGNIDRSAYHYLLEDLQAVTRHVYDARAVRNKRQDRLYTSVVEIYRRTSPFIRDFRSNPDTSSLQLVLQFVRETQTFLSSLDARIDWELQPLRRHFCGIVSNLFTGLAAFKDSDRFISPNARLRLFRLCEEWCLLGRQSEAAERQQFEMRAALSRLQKSSHVRERAGQIFEAESNALSKIAAVALCALCEGAFFSQSVESPTGDMPVPLDAMSVMDRLNAMLSSPDTMIVDSACSALHDLLVHSNAHKALYDHVLQCCLLTPCANKARIRCFDVVTKILTQEPNRHHFTLAQSLILGLQNITHSQTECRRNSLRILQSIASGKSATPSSLIRFEASIESQAANIVLHARQQLTETFSSDFKDETPRVLSQATKLLITESECSPLDMHSAARNTLQFLDPWLSNIEIVPEGHSHPSNYGLSIMHSLTMLTSRFVTDFPDYIQSLWARLVGDKHPMNTASIVGFLMDQASKRGSATFASCVASIVACLSRTPVARRIVEDLCSFIEPQDMLPVGSRQQRSPIEDNFEFLLDTSFHDEGKSSPHLAPAQLAWIFLSDIALDKAWELVYQLPSLLHIVFVHLGHSDRFLQGQARKMLFQTLRSWLPGLETLKSSAPSVGSGRSIFNSLMTGDRDLFWDDDDSDSAILSKVAVLSNEVLQLLEPIVPTLRQDWGVLALDWGTSCPVRGVASKSLKIFRVLNPVIDKPTVASLIGRLSNTIADEDPNLQLFGAELIVTLQSLTSSDHLDPSLLPLLFWCAASCLLTPTECEYVAALDFLDTLLDRLDLDDLSVTDALLANKPNTWVGPEFSLQDLLLQGLRSSRTSDRSVQVLCRLAAIEPPDLLDPSGTRVRDLYTIAVVLFLDSMDHGPPPEHFARMANDAAKLADVAGLSGISRILVSFSRNRFRTKDDFARQAIASLREQFAGRHWNDVVILLLSMVLNQQQWMREKAMLVLKAFFQHRDARHPTDPLSAELLMPLLRLLQTDLAAQALEVLDVHMPMSNDEGLAAKDVLRMSMHDLAKVTAPSTGTHVFGIPLETGWSVGDFSSAQDICRQNAINVFESCRTAARPSMIRFELDTQPQAESYVEPDPLEAQSLGDLVSTLHDINSFFQDDHSTLQNPLSPTFIEAEGRVADILGRSLNKSATDLGVFSEYDASAPLPTPFVGAFNVSHSSSNGDMTPHSFSFGDMDGSSESDQDDDDDKFTFEKFIPKPSRLRSSSAFLRRGR